MQMRASIFVFVTFIIGVHGLLGQEFSKRQDEQRQGSILKLPIVKRGRPNCQISMPISIDEYPQSETRLVNGNLPFVFREVFGISRPRLVVESKNPGIYEVIFDKRENRTLQLLASSLDLILEQDVRRMKALAIRICEDGHKLNASANPDRLEIEDVLSEEDGSFLLRGAAIDDVAKLLERELRYPCVNQTKITGLWDIDVKRSVFRTHPEVGKSVPIPNTGLELFLSDELIEVFVVRDPS